MNDSTTSVLTILMTQNKPLLLIIAAVAECVLFSCIATPRYRGQSDRDICIYLYIRSKPDPTGCIDRTPKTCILLCCSFLLFPLIPTVYCVVLLFLIGERPHGVNWGNEAGFNPTRRLLCSFFLFFLGFVFVLFIGCTFWRIVFL